MDADSDVSLPRSTMAQKIREAFPSELRVAGNTMDLIIECCTEFVQLITSEANEVCIADSKATINPEHIIKALQQLEFTDCIDELTELMEQYKQENRGDWLQHHKTGCLSLDACLCDRSHLLKLEHWCVICRCWQAKAGAQEKQDQHLNDRRRSYCTAAAAV